MGVYESVTKLITPKPPATPRLVQLCSSADPDAAVLRSTCTGTLAERLGVLDAELAPHKELLEAGGAPAAQYFRGNDRDVAKLYALKQIGVTLRQRGIMMYDEAIALMRAHRSGYIEKLNTTLSSESQRPMVAWQAQKAGNEMLCRLPLLRVPLHCFGAYGGSAQSFVMPSLSCVTDAELLGHIDLVKEMYEQHLASKQPNGETFNSAQFTLLINAFPAPTRAAIKYMIVKLPGGDAIGQQLGMSKSEMNGLQRRFDKICSESLPAAMREAEVSILADLKRRGNLTDAAIARACSPRAQLERYRRIINQQHVLRDHRLVTAQKFEEVHPDVLDLLRNAVRANSADVSFKARGDTPVDAMIVEPSQHLKGAGGQKERFARYLNAALASRGLSISPSLIPRLVKAAGIISGGLLRIKDTPKIGDKYCAAFVKTQRQFQYLISAYAPRIGLDQMKNLKCNTDANSANMGGNRSRYQLQDERLMTHSHGAGGDHLCKLGLEALLMESVREGSSVKFPDGFDLRKYVPSYSADRFCRAQPALAHMYVHIQEREPESAFRDFADLSEFVSRFPHRFLTPELKLSPFFFLERDNAHGVATIETRFSAIVFCLIHGVYYLGLISQESGRSRWHRVEQVNGAATRVITGEAFDLPMNVPDNPPEDIKTAAQDEVLEQVIGKFPATYKAGGAEDGFVSAEKPRSTALACGFEWRTRELRAFVDSAKKGRVAIDSFLADATSLTPMPAFVHPLGYGGVLRLAWRLLHTTGALGCTKQTAHSFEYKFNPANPGCPPPDLESQAAIDVFEGMLRLEGVGEHASEGAKGDGFLPQPRPSQPGWRGAPEYAALDERLACGGATEVDQYYPKRLLDLYIDQFPQLLALFTSHDRKLPPAELEKLTNLLCVDETKLYAELAERANKEEYKALYESMKARQMQDGTLECIEAITAGLIGKPLGAPKSWPHVPDLKKVVGLLPGKVKIPMNPKRAVLIQLIAFTWRQLPEATLLTRADSAVADDVVDEEEQDDADEQVAEAAAEATIETTLELIDAKKCGLCYGWFEAAEVHWDAGPYCYVCKDDVACAERRPGGRGRKRKGAGRNDYAAMNRG